MNYTVRRNSYFLLITFIFTKAKNLLKYNFFFARYFQINCVFLYVYKNSTVSAVLLPKTTYNFGQRSVYITCRVVTIQSTFIELSSITKSHIDFQFIAEMQPYIVPTDQSGKLKSYLWYNFLDYFLFRSHSLYFNRQMQ